MLFYYIRFRDKLIYKIKDIPVVKYYKNIKGFANKNGYDSESDYTIKGYIYEETNKNL